MSTAGSAITNALARRLYMASLKASGQVNPPADMYDRHAKAVFTGASFVEKWEAKARVAIRCLCEHGPTTAMLTAYEGLADEWRMEIGETVP